MTTATVTARGEAVVPARPDEGIWIIELSVLDGAPDAALSEVATRSRSLEALLGDLGIPAEKRSTSGVTVREEYDYVDGKQTRRGFRAENTVTIRVADHTIAGRLIQEATSAAKANVRGPSWWIAPGNPARLDACRRAVESAQRKAEAYADALGRRLGPVLEIREPGAGIQPLPKGGGMLAMRTMAAESAPIDVDPGELDVEASVEVTFQLAD
jgi:uncharacterized protein YggE